MIINRPSFFSNHRRLFGSLNQSQVNGLIDLLDGFEKDTALTDIRWVAYMLATVKHECADTWLPIKERGPGNYFDKYEPGTSIGKRLGNTVKGDGYKFPGRGFVMITGRDNYARFSKPGRDLIANPDLALDPAIAFDIMSEGMRRGRFTGKRLLEYIDGDKCDYYQARRIINVLDQAHKIASYALKFEGVLSASAIDTSTMSTPVEIIT